MQQPATRIEVAAIESPSACSREVVGRSASESRQGGVAWVELRPVAVRLLEVVAEDLVALHKVVLREPVRELLVQLRPSRLRKRLVGGVADEQVPEAVTLVLGKRRRHGTDQLLADERREV